MYMCASVRVWSELTATIAKEHTHTNNSNNDDLCRSLDLRYRIVMKRTIFVLIILFQ